MKHDHPKLSRSFQKWLLLLVAFAFLVTTVFLWLFQTKLARDNAISLLRLNMTDVRQNIVDASNEHLLELSWQIADQLNDTPEITDELLLTLTRQYDVSEINYINQEGFITASTYPDFLGYDMRSGDQSAEFMVLLEGQSEYVQSYRPVTYDTSLSRKYGGVILENGGFVQVGYDAQRFQRDIQSFVRGVTRNRHVGEEGCMIITDEQWCIVSDRHGNEGKDLSVTGLQADFQQVPAGQPFTAQIYGQSCYCIYQVQEGYCILAVLPRQEAALSRNISVGVTTVMEVLIFGALFVIIYYLVKKLVVKDIHRVNRALSQITDGNLETVVDVRSHWEFSELSDGINTTVDALKGYIADAAARIDQELDFAKSIQHSALPSVFPPYPNRKEFGIWAEMFTAREVGGDFYDFYFVNENTLAFLVADVSGKGIPAAMFMMTAKTLLKSYAESGMDVEQVLTNANNELCAGNDASMFVTVWMGMLNTETGLVRYANAGHNFPLLRRRDGSTEYVKATPGLVLAGMEGIQYRQQELQLQKGDVLYLYTDGVTEATDLSDQPYGEDRLRQAVSQMTEPQSLCALVKAEVDAFAGQAPQFDDITMLTLAYHGPRKEGAQ